MTETVPLSMLGEAPEGTPLIVHGIPVLLLWTEPADPPHPVWVYVAGKRWTEEPGGVPITECHLDLSRKLGQVVGALWADRNWRDITTGLVEFHVLRGVIWRGIWGKADPAALKALLMRLGGE